MPLRQPSFSMASGADLPSAASDGDSQSESDVIPVQRNEADFVPETEDEDEDVSSDAGVVEPAKKKKQGNIRVGRYDYMLMLRSISAKRLFVFLDTALPPWVACFCLQVTVSFQSPNGGESFDMCTCPELQVLRFACMSFMFSFQRDHASLPSITNALVRLNCRSM